ncbi:hypothetical protein, partial [Escherichia coli]
DCCQTGQFSQDVADGALTNVRPLLAHLLYHVKVLSAQHVDVLSGVRTLRKQHVGWSGQSKW